MLPLKNAFINRKIRSELKNIVEENLGFEIRNDRFVGSTYQAEIYFDGEFTGLRIIGEFIKPIPIVVSSTLLASLFVALFITLPVMVLLLKPSLPRRVKVLLVVLIVIVIFGLAFVFAPKNRSFSVK